MGTFAADLASNFTNPPDSDRPWVYWWWLDGAASKEGITRDLEEMRRQGIGGFILVDAGMGGPDAPKGPPFMSEPWRESFRHAVREAGRLGLLVCVNLCSGWNAGGTWVTLEDAIKRLVWTEITIDGPAKVDRELPQPHIEHNWYRDIAVLACRPDDNKIWKRQELVDLTAKMHDGRLQWDAPKGRWTILRLGYTVDAGKMVFGISAKTKCSSANGSEGWEVDPWSADAMDRHFEATAATLIEDAGTLTGKVLVQLHIDSWETMQPTWTPGFLEEFRKRRGYDALPFLPALAGMTVDSPEITARFTWDYRRTAADLVAANHYGRMGELARRHGLKQDSESGGPFFFHAVDALQCEGINEIPMGEFWGRTSEFDRPAFGTPTYWKSDNLRQAASAAHIYGREICQAEAFTAFSEDWIEDPWWLKDVGDEAFCDGVTRMVIHNFTHQSQLDKVPGYYWGHVGPHISPDTTWWDMGDAWLLYLRRCQFMLRQGRFVADVAYYYGEDAGRFVPSKETMAPPPPEGFDHDTLNAEILLEDASVKDGRLVLSSGMSYKCLVLPHAPDWNASPPVLRKIARLVEDGLTVIGPRPALHAPGLTGYPECDQEVRALVRKIWGDDVTSSGARRVGRGVVVWGKAPAAVLTEQGLTPDVELRNGPADTKLDWIHRRIDVSNESSTSTAPDSGNVTDIYFISNQRATPLSVEVVLRTSGQRPELFDAVTGETRPLPEFRTIDGRTAVPMSFEPRQSFFMVFRRPAASAQPSTSGSNFPEVSKLSELAGPWEVSFDPKWGGPGNVTFATLDDWTTRTEPGIRYYSGKAVYRKTFDLDLPLAEDQSASTYLCLGRVKNVARVRLNGSDLGVVWTAPWRINITEALQEKANRLEIEVANLWPNRLIGDAKLPPDKRFTRTNVTTYMDVPLGFSPPGGCKACDERQATHDVERFLLPSGLLGPVTLDAANAGTGSE